MCRELYIYGYKMADQLRHSTYNPFRTIIWLQFTVRSSYRIQVNKSCEPIGYLLIYKRMEALF